LGASGADVAVRGDASRASFLSGLGSGAPRLNAAIRSATSGSTGDFGAATSVS
jgi:hypothetical protein